MLITIAIPCYKSSKTLPVVVEGLKAEFRNRPEYDYQLVLVDDCSPDGGETFRTIQSLAQEDPKIVGVGLSKNFGQASAKMAAVEYVQGDILVYMDDDGQHAPADVFQLVKAVEDGADMAIAHFQGKQHSGFKRFTSWLNSELLRITIHKPKDIHTSSFAAYSRFLVDLLKSYKSPYVATFAFLLQHTNRIVNVPLEHHKRMEGESGYTLKKLFKLWGDGMFSYSTVPLKLVLIAGVCCLGAGVAFLIAALVMAILGAKAQTVLIVGVMFFLAGVVLFGQSLLGEYIGRIYMTQNQLPQYTVRQVVRRDAAEEESEGEFV